MFRISGSAARNLAVTIAVVTLSFSLAGCGSSGGGDSPDAGPTVCTQTQVDAIFSRNCISCHFSAGAYAALNLSSAGLTTRLLGVAPPGGGAPIPSACAGMSKIYLVQGSSPATGLLLDKLGNNAGCGVRMPYLSSALASTDIACIQSWANTVTKP